MKSPQFQCILMVAIQLTTVAFSNVAQAASGTTTTYTAHLLPLNGSNVVADAIFTFDDSSKQLTVQLSGSNLEPFAEHAILIDGRFDVLNNAVNTVAATMADDTDGDGFIESTEGALSMGHSILPLLPITTTTGSVTRTYTLDLTDGTQFNSPYTIDSLFPLNQRGIAILGRTVATGVGAGTSGEVNGTGGYIPGLAVAFGDVVGEPIPEPATLSIICTSAICLFSLKRRR
jgi:hypothetical protein